MAHSRNRKVCFNIIYESAAGDLGNCFPPPFKRSDLIFSEQSIGEGSNKYLGRSISKQDQHCDACANLRRSTYACTCDTVCAFLSLRMSLLLLLPFRASYAISGKQYAANNTLLIRGSESSCVEERDTGRAVSAKHDFTFLEPGQNRILSIDWPFNCSIYTYTHTEYSVLMETAGYFWRHLGYRQTFQTEIVQFRGAQVI